MLKVKEALERSRLTSEVFNRVTEANNLFVASACSTNPAEADSLFQQAQAQVNQADAVRDQFWARYPQALIPPTCPWMNRND